MLLVPENKVWSERRLFAVGEGSCRDLWLDKALRINDHCKLIPKGDMCFNLCKTQGTSQMKRKKKKKTQEPEVGMKAVKCCLLHVARGWYSWTYRSRGHLHEAFPANVPVWIEKGIMKPPPFPEEQLSVNGCWGRENNFLWWRSHG